MRPNYIPGMPPKGTKRGNLVPHFKKREAKYLIQEAQTKKKKLEDKRREKNNAAATEV